MFSLKIRLFQDFPKKNKLNDLKFEIPKIVWGGAHRPPSPDLSPALSRASRSIPASPSNLGRFTPSIRASPDSDPLTFEAWLRPRRSIVYHFIIQTILYLMDFGFVT
jgi:hypothetical protein